MAASGSRPPSARVSRVSRVAKTNASAGAPLATAEERRWRYARAYGSIDPEMSQRSTSRRGRVRRLRLASVIGSPPVRRLPRRVRRRSRCSPRLARRLLRARRLGAASCACLAARPPRLALARSGRRAPPPGPPPPGPPPAPTRRAPRRAAPPPPPLPLRPPAPPPPPPACPGNQRSPCRSPHLAP